MFRFNVGNNKSSEKRKKEMGWSVINRNLKDDAHYAPRREGQNRKRGSYSFLLICGATIFEPSFAQYFKRWLIILAQQELILYVIFMILLTASSLWMCSVVLQ